MDYTKIGTHKNGLDLYIRNDLCFGGFDFRFHIMHNAGLPVPQDEVAALFGEDVFCTSSRLGAVAMSSFVQVNNGVAGIEDYKNPYLFFNTLNKILDVVAKKGFKLDRKTAQAVLMDSLKTRYSGKQLADLKLAKSVNAMPFNIGNKEF